MKENGSGISAATSITRHNACGVACICPRRAALRQVARLMACNQARGNVCSGRRKTADINGGWRGRRKRLGIPGESSGGGETGASAKKTWRKTMTWRAVALGWRHYRRRKPARKGLLGLPAPLCLPLKDAGVTVRRGRRSSHWNGVLVKWKLKCGLPCGICGERHRS